MSRFPYTVLLIGLFALFLPQPTYESGQASPDEVVLGVEETTLPADPVLETKTEDGSSSCSAEGVDGSNDSGRCPSEEVANDDGKMDDSTNTKDEFVSDDADEDGSPTNLQGFVQLFKRLGTSWSHVFGVYIDTVRSAHGKNLSGDLYADDINAALDLLRDLVAKARKSAAEQESAEGGERMWEFRSVPLEEFGRTLDDVFVAFLRWSAVDIVDEDDECDRGMGGINMRDVTRINVSNAFRRLQAYAAWMEEEANDLVDPPLTSSSVSEAREHFFLRVSPDACGRIVWWLDLGQTDFSAIKELPHKDILRLFVWLAHFIFFNKNAQENGIIFVDNMAKVSLLQYMTMLPLNLGLMIDKFMICVIPLKTKMVVFMKRPLWFDVGFGMLKMFLREKMRKRVVLREGDQGSVEEIVGADRVPVGFDEFKGSLELDLIAEHEKRDARHS